ncbi:extracellular solute-binding protein [Saccharophagus sp. K07]|uniref:extracellular solute-binding protein n=1 Tax=Saccharophagus sp. K07 TaxID=2283636 RepID=UPI001651DE87|nr:extracellular solute-binding protein [Saccharophagus sp. K07]MBC6906349.1 extracellular solute-binding protein [Saccharophagus sp. K07]
MRFLGTAAAVTASVVLALSGCTDKKETASPAAKKPEITVYSERVEHLIKPLFDLYTKETGVNIRFITDGAGPLIARLENEGEATPADMLITVDAGNLWHAAQKGLLRSIDSPILEANIPNHLQASNNQWFGLSARARTIVYSTERVKPEELSTYEDLADPKWKGRLCLRTSKKVYNQSLVATMINTLGEEQTEKVIRGWVDNLATDPYSNDTLALEAVIAGQCDLAIVNTYYFGRMQKENPSIPLAVFWPNQADRGVHVNISGAGITKHAKHPEEAQKLLEWLSQEEAQYMFAEANEEYPVNPKVKPSPLVQAWGEFYGDLVNVEATGYLQADAVKLMDRAGYR